MQIKSTLYKAAELGVILTALTTLILVGCGGGGSTSGGATTTGATTSATITPYKGPFAPGATVTITDANGNPVTLLTGGTVGANGVISVTYNQNVAYPLLVSVTGSYYNEITKQMETTTVPLRGLITDAAGATNVPVTIITETAVALLMNQTGSISATNPLQAASAVAALNSAGTMYGIPASAVPSFTATNMTSDPDTILLSALAVVANSQAGTTLADKVVALANSLASLNAASAPSDVIGQAALASAIAAMTSGASSVAAAGVTPPTAPTISTAFAAPLDFNASIAAANSIVGTWNSGDTLNSSVITFFANGDYMQAKAATTNAGATPGIEHGTYTWDSTTGAVTPICPAAVDTNGSDGLCNGSVATPATIKINGDTMTFSGWVINGGVPGTLKRVIGNPLVGSWYNLKTNGVSQNFGTPTTTVITFFANGDYLQAQSVTSGAGEQPGLEHGTYTWNPATGAFTIACPTVDTNGQAGFSAAKGVQCAQGTTADFGTLTVNGNQLTYHGTDPNPYTFDRVYSTTPGSILGAAAANVASLLADQQSGFTGGWWLTQAVSAVTPGQSAGAALASAQVAADAYENTVVANGLNNYTQTYADKRMTSTPWGPNSGPGVSYILPAAGSWIAQSNTATIVDNLDGTFTWTPTGQNSELVSVTRSDLSGTVIACTDFFSTTITCPSAGNYPTGAALYTFSNVPNSDEFLLFGSNPGVPSAVAVLPVTDASGTALTALPAFTQTTTLCDPNSFLVFQAISPAPASGDNVNVFATASCLQADITTATATTAMGTVSATVQPTGNATVTSVIRIQATAPVTAFLNNSILGVRAGAVYPGYMNPAGIAYTSSDLNKIAVNAELVANGLTPIP